MPVTHVSLSVLVLLALAGAALAPACGGDSDGERAGAGGASANASAGGASANAGASGKAGTTGAGAAGTSGAPPGGSGGTAAGGGSAGQPQGGGTGKCGARPSVAPPGWTELVEGAWTCECRLYRDPSPEAAPAWEWTKCPDDAPPGVACELLVEPSVNGMAWQSALGSGSDHEGNLVIGRRRYPLDQVKGLGQGRRYEVVDPSSGRSRLSLFSTYKPLAQLVQEPPSTAGGLNSGRLVLKVYGTGNGLDHTQAGFTYGTVVVDLDPAVPVSTRLVTTADTSGTLEGASVSDDGVLVHRKGIQLHPFDGGAPVAVYSASDDPQGLPGYLQAVRGSTVFLSADAAGKAGFYVWTPAKGLQPLLRVPFDNTKAWAGLGTDGHDMVWSFAEGQPTAEYDFPKQTVFTAPYTTDPAQLAATARSLGPDDNDSSFAMHYIVGCGYAAEGGSSKVGAKGKAGVNVIRLSDGARWVLQNNTVEGIEVTAVTCDHVYLSLAGGRQVRVRIDSLGAPL